MEIRESKWIVALLVCCFAALSFPIGSAQSPADKPSLEKLAWFAGSWERVTDKAQTEEHWTRAAGGTMIGMGRTLAGGGTVFFEYLRIEARPDGIYYVAQPRGRTAVDFKLTRAEAQEVLFENPAHDHPKRILYRKNSDGSITARIEGDEKGKPVSEEFHYRPMKPVR